MVPGPGNCVPSTLVISPAASMPCAMRSLKIEVAAYSASRCIGLVSPVTAANSTMSASVMVLENFAERPTVRSSKA